MTGHVSVIGIGPGDEKFITPDVQFEIGQASHVLGYVPYVQRLATHKHLTFIPSDNRVELDRAKQALELAQTGVRVLLVSSGDPGVFAMASALFEAMERYPNLAQISVSVHPGVTAMLAAAARLGAPLGHDFCAINLSDNLKPFDLVCRRVRLAAEADFAMAFYNPRSASRPYQFGEVLDVLRSVCEPTRLIAFARAVGRSDETLSVATLAEAKPEMADMQTIVIVGNQSTRRVGKYIYTPRYAGAVT